MTDSAASYPSAPPPYAGTPGPQKVPGRTLGIVAFIVSFFAGLIGLILGIVALVQSRKAGAKNGFAVAAIIVGVVMIVIGIIITIVAVVGASQLIATCAELGPGEHVTSTGVVVTCGG